MNKRSFGEYIKSKRIQNHLTQNELALLLAVEASTVKRWERGSALPDSEQMEGICRILDIKEHETDASEAVCQSMTSAARSVTPQAPAPRKASKGYTACKWIFFGAFMALVLFGGVYFLKHIQLFSSTSFFDELFDALKPLSVGKELSYSYRDFLPLSTILFGGIVILGIFSAIMLKVTGKGQPVTGRRSRPIGVAGAILLCIGSVAWILLNSTHIPGIYSAMAQEHPLPIFVSALGAVGIAVCLLLKKPRLCGIFAILPLLFAAHRLVGVIPLVMYGIKDLALVLDTYLPILFELVFFILFIIKCFKRSTGLNTPLVIFTVIFLAYTFNRIPHDFTFIERSVLMFYLSARYLGLALLCASRVRLKRSFVTDAMRCLAKPAPFILGALAALGATLVIQVLVDTINVSTATIIILLFLLFSYPIFFVFLFSMLLFPKPKTATQYQRGNI
ncbi:MAG: helix-turn-helix transcriptional regulator [Clostridia bacterium]|nr:helix-turn-helix transcriptional regulator [Clostridia bacterium]